MPPGDERKNAMNLTAERQTSMKVMDVMTKDPLCVTPSENIGQADELMSENNFRQLPVVEGRALVGIVTDRDIRSFLSAATLASPEEREQALRTAVPGRYQSIQILTDDGIMRRVDDGGQPLIS